MLLGPIIYRIVPDILLYGFAIVVFSLVGVLKTIAREIHDFLKAVYREVFIWNIDKTNAGDYTTNFLKLYNIANHHQKITMTTK